MKLHVIASVNRLNVEHRTSDFERPIIMVLRFIYFKMNELRQRRDLPSEITKADDRRKVDSLCLVFFLC